MWASQAEHTRLQQSSWIYNSALAHILMACYQHQITASYIHLRNKHNCQNSIAVGLIATAIRARCQPLETLVAFRC